MSCFEVGKGKRADSLFSDQVLMKRTWQPIAQRSTVLYTGEEDPLHEHQLLPDKAGSMETVQLCVYATLYGNTHLYHYNIDT